MANQEHLDILKQDVTEWNRWRLLNLVVQSDLSHADLSGKDLSHADLYRVNLSGAKLSGAVLYRVNLSGGDLSGANLSGANLSYTDLHDVDLRGANLSGADLNGADLSGADLRQVNLSKVNLSKVNLSGKDLSGANLSYANLSYADLYRANLNKSNLSHADLTGANLNYALLEDAILVHAKMCRANLNRATLVGTNLAYANLADCSIHGISVWNVDLEEATQSNLIITDVDKPIITVDNLKVAQFIYLLLNNQEIRIVLNSVMERGVLLLGRFSDGGLELLQSIAAKLREIRYLPIIFDFDRPDSRNLTETVMTLVGLSRFVIVDLSGRSVANELRSTVPHFKIPFVPIVDESRKKEVYSMFSDFLENDWVLPLITFTNRENLLELLPSRVIEPAERKCEERQIQLKQIFNR
jgi:uncharacterized protein YjbI with pentapeptide repeats